MCDGVGRVSGLGAPAVVVRSISFHESDHDRISKIRIFGRDRASRSTPELGASGVSPDLGWCTVRTAASSTRQSVTRLQNTPPPNGANISKVAPGQVTSAAITGLCTFTFSRIFCPSLTPAGFAEGLCMLASLIGGLRSGRLDLKYRIDVQNEDGGIVHTMQSQRLRTP